MVMWTHGIDAGNPRSEGPFEPSLAPGAGRRPSDHHRPRSADCGAGARGDRCGRGMGARAGGKRAGDLERWEAGWTGRSHFVQRPARISVTARGSPVTLYLDSSSLVKLY